MDDSTVRERVHDLALRSRLEEQLVDRLTIIKDKRLKERKNWDDIVTLLIAPRVNPEDPGGVDPALTADRLKAFCRRGGRNLHGWADPVGKGKGRKPKDLPQQPPVNAANNSMPIVKSTMPGTGEANELKPASHQSGSAEPVVPKQIESEMTTSTPGQQLDPETRKLNRELAMKERREKRAELQEKHGDRWKRYVHDPDFDYNLDGSLRDPYDSKTWIEDPSWFDLP